MSSIQALHFIKSCIGASYPVYTGLRLPFAESWITRAANYSVLLYSVLLHTTLWTPVLSHITGFFFSFKPSSSLYIKSKALLRTHTIKSKGFPKRFDTLSILQVTVLQLHSNTKTNHHLQMHTMQLKSFAEMFVALSKLQVKVLQFTSFRIINFLLYRFKTR